MIFPQNLYIYRGFLHNCHVWLPEGKYAYRFPVIFISISTVALRISNPWEASSSTTAGTSRCLTRGLRTAGWCRRPTTRPAWSMRTWALTWITTSWIPTLWMLNLLRTSLFFLLHIYIYTYDPVFRPRGPPQWYGSPGSTPKYLRATYSLPMPIPIGGGGRGRAASYIYIHIYIYTYIYIYIYIYMPI